MSDFEIGQKVLLNGKMYKIIGTIKKSFLLERGGKRYKATAAKMGKIKDQNSNGIGNSRKKREKKSATHYMEQRLAYRRIFDKTVQLPSTEEELMLALEQLSGEFSPENLSCDGELSRTAINKKFRAIKAEWKEVERLLGRKVSNDEVEMMMIERWKNK